MNNTTIEIFTDLLKIEIGIIIFNLTAVIILYIINTAFRWEPFEKDTTVGKMTTLAGSLLGCEILVWLITNLVFSISFSLLY